MLSTALNSAQNFHLFIFLPPQAGKTLWNMFIAGHRFFISALSLERKETSQMLLHASQTQACLWDLSKMVWCPFFFFFPNLSSGLFLIQTGNWKFCYQSQCLCSCADTVTAIRVIKAAINWKKPNFFILVFDQDHLLLIGCLLNLVSHNLSNRVGELSVCQISRMK